MAIYHLTTKTVSRGVNISVAARSDYSERSGRYADDEVEVLLKGRGNMPTRAETVPRNYREAADAHERANGRIYSFLKGSMMVLPVSRVCGSSGRQKTRQKVEPEKQTSCARGNGCSSAGSGGPSGRIMLDALPGVRRALINAR